MLGKKLLLLLFLIPVLSWAATNGSWANIKAKDYVDYKNSIHTNFTKEDIEKHIMSLAEAYSSSNAWNQSKKQERSFCAPEEVGLNLFNYIQIIDNEIKEFPHTLKDNHRLSLILLSGLGGSFPCNNQ